MKKNKTIVVFAYAATGKTYLGKQRDDVIDLTTYPFKYELPEHEEECEEIKGAAH